MPVLFGGHVVGSADAGAGQVLVLVEDLRDAEISQFHFFVKDEYVGGLEVTVEDAFVVHVEDGECNLCGPLEYLFFLDSPASVVFLLLYDELVHVSSGAVLHDDVEFLSLLDALTVGDDVDVFELLEQLDLVVDILDLLFVLAVEFNLLDNVVLALLFMAGQVGIPEGAYLAYSYP